MTGINTTVIATIWDHYPVHVTKIKPSFIIINVAKFVNKKDKTS